MSETAMPGPLGRRALAEFIGTPLLVVGSGVVALIAVILALGPISGTHLNPVLTLLDRSVGGTSTVDALTFVGAMTIRALYPGTREIAPPLVPQPEGGGP